MPRKNSGWKNVFPGWKLFTCLVFTYTTNVTCDELNIQAIWKAIFVENNELRTKENMALWPRPRVSVPIFAVEPGKTWYPQTCFKRDRFVQIFFWHESKGIEGWFKSDGTVVTIVLNLWKAYLFGASVLRVWFFPAKNGVNKHLETGKLQEFLDDGNGNLKGIKMVNVRWEKIDGQMRLLDKKQIL